MAKKKKQKVNNDIDKKLDNLKKKLDEIINEQLIEHSLGNNEIEFEIDKVKYKVVRPTFKDKQLAYQKKVEMYIKLLNEKDENGEFIHKTEEDLKKLYKKRGINLDEIDNKIKALDAQINNYKLKLGEALAADKPDNELNVYKEEIEKLLEEQKELNLKKSLLLEPSIESQVMVYSLTYLTFLITYKFEDGEWKKAWDNFDDFLNTDERIVNTISFYASLVIDIQNELSL